MSQFRGTPISAEPDFLEDLTEPSRPHNPDGIGSRLAIETNIDPEALMQEYREQVDRVRDADYAVVNQKRKMADLAARFGTRGEKSGSHYDSMRSSFRAQLAEKRRAELLPLGKDELKAVTGSGSLSEAYLETYSKAHPEYVAYLAKADKELRAWERAQADLSERFADLRHEQRVLSEIEARVSMFKALGYAYSAEARLTS